MHEKSVYEVYDGLLEENRASHTEGFLAALV